MLVATSESGSAPLALLEVPSLPLRGDEVRVRVHAAGVNPVDWKMRDGNRSPLRLAQRFLGPRGPLVVGVDFAGEVIELGPRASDLALGTRVVGGTNFARGQRGSYATEVVVRPDQCVAIPDAIDYVHAACLPVAAVTPWVVFKERTRLDSDARVLVLGASGGVGLFAIQLAKILGATPVGVCSTRNVALVERLGAIAVDYTQGDALEAARAHGPYRVVLHLQSTSTYPIPRCRALLAAGGHVEIVAPVPADYPAIGLRRDVKTVLGRPTRERLAPLVELLGSGRLEATIEATFPLADAERAHQRSRAGKVVGKLVLVP